MKRLLLASVMVLSSGAITLGAQGPGGDPAEFLLSHTGELRLTDAQVTRLAAIARRSADRRRSMRTQMDSMRGQFTRAERPDSAARAQMRQRMESMRPAMERMREQSLADRRDAIAVLTPDQQAQAWDRIARMGQARGRGLDGRGRGFRGQDFGPGRNGNRAAPVRPGMRGGQGFGPGRIGPPGDGVAAPGDDRRPRRPRPEIEN